MATAGEWVARKMDHIANRAKSGWQASAIDSGWPSPVGETVKYREVETTRTSGGSNSAAFASIDLSLFAKAAAIGPNRFEIDLLTDLIAMLDAQLHLGRFELLGAAAAFLPFDRVSPQVIVTVLRTLASASSRIPRWTALVQAAAKSLSDRNLDAVQILRGLI